MLLNSRPDRSNGFSARGLGIGTLLLICAPGWFATTICTAQSPLVLPPPAFVPSPPFVPSTPGAAFGSQSTPANSAPVVSGAYQPQTRVAGKAAISAVDKWNDGATYVALASGLQSVFSGREPSSLQELKALELQQSMVAKAIERVTVNVQQGTAQGSGVIITADGYVLTAAHVAGGKDRDAIVILNDGTELKARTLGMNRDKDAGLLKIEDARFAPLPYATIGRSSELRVGQWCIASGHPGGWKPERGAVIRVGRILKISKSRDEKDAHTLFTDCALIGGDSGGPLFTLEGRLIGIHSRIGTDVEDNMHVPIDVYNTNWDRMVKRDVWGMLPGYQPVIGVGGTKDSGPPQIDTVETGGAAHQAGMLVGDLVLACDGNPISTFAELRQHVEQSMPGDVMILKVKRGEQILQLALTVGVREG